MFPGMKTLSLLQDILYQRGPCGQENEVRDYCLKYLFEKGYEAKTDAAGNVIVHIEGKNPDATPVHLLAHMDEIALIVKRVEPDASLKVEPLGGFFPYNYGQGPVEILAENEIVPAVLSMGSVHVSKESGSTWEIQERGAQRTVTCKDLKVTTGLTVEQLEEKGIYPGTRVVLAQERRKIFPFSDYIGAYFLDNRAAVVIGLKVLESLVEKPERDFYLVLTTSEEQGCFGAAHVSLNLPQGYMIAVDVGPVEKEYSTVLNDQPIIVYKDGLGIYDKALSDRLYASAKRLGLKPQRALFEGYGSDSSRAQSLGHTGKSALICFPTENTHGFEIMHPNALETCSQVLTHFLFETHNDTT